MLFLSEYESRAEDNIDEQSFWWPNISLLGFFFVSFTAASYMMLHFFVKEKR